MKKKYLILTIIILTIITFSFYSSKVQPVIENKKNVNQFYQW